MNGLLLGYVIYTIPISFMLIFNAMSYIDKKYMVVSKVMGDKGVQTFWITIIRPLLGTLAASFVQSFFLSFTDFGIPAAVVAVVMLIPSVISIVLLHYLEKYNVRYNKISSIEMRKNSARDIFCGVVSSLFCISMLAVFLVIFVIPFVEEWPYEISFTLEHVKKVWTDSELLGVYGNSLYVAFFTVLFGTFLAYGSALVTARSKVHKVLKRVVEGIALVTNTIPGMVLGLAFLFVFSGTGLQNTFGILVLCNVIHFFSIPYLMMKESLAKMNASWETTAMLMGDNWLKTIIRIVTPNAVSTIIEVFSYYFMNAMVTISAVIFLAGARTMVITTKIKQLQYYNQYQEIFVLSLLLLLTNLVCKAVFQYLAKRGHKVELVKAADTRKERVRQKTARMIKRIVAGVLAVILVISGISLVTGGGNQDLVVIYSNGDDEAITAMKKTLEENGYKGKYLLQTFGTSELGGKLLAEGKNLEADMITMSTFYIDSAQEQNEMFADLTFEHETLGTYPSYCTPMTAQEGTMKGIKIGSTTGYTDSMMEIVVPKAKEVGYEPDAWFSPDAVGNMGRPYPFMVFQNMEVLKVGKVQQVIKVGDTVSDILEGKHAGVISVGVVEGSSEMGLTQEEYESLSSEEKHAKSDKVKKIFLDAGADFAIQDMRGLVTLIDLLGE